MMLAVGHSGANWITGELDLDPPPPNALMMEATGAVVNSVLTLKVGSETGVAAEPAWVAPYTAEASTGGHTGASGTEGWIEYDFWSAEVWSPLPTFARPSRLSMALWGDRMNPLNVGAWPGQADIANHLIERDGLGDPERFLTELASRDWIGERPSPPVGPIERTVPPEVPRISRRFMGTWILVSLLLFVLLRMRTYVISWRS